MAERLAEAGAGGNVVEAVQPARHFKFLRLPGPDRRISDNWQWTLIASG
jgi:hypothetical protein